MNNLDILKQHHYNKVIHYRARAEGGAGGALVAKSLLVLVAKSLPLIQNLTNDWHRYYSSSSKKTVR